MRLILLAVLLLGSSACSEEARPPEQPVLTFESLPKSDYKSVNPAVSFVAGYRIEASDNEALSSLSDLIVTPMAAGDQAMGAISDWGAYVQFDLKGQAETGFGQSPTHLTFLKSAEDKPYVNKRFADAEDLAADPVTGDVYVSFEAMDRIERFTKERGFSSPGERLPLKGLPTFPGNQGMEALSLVRNDAGKASLLIGVEAGGFWQCETEGEYQCRPVAGPKVPGLLYKIVSLAPIDPSQTGPTRDLLALYRYYEPVTGLKNILTHVVWDGEKLKQVEVLAKITKPMPVDNYEGVSAVKTAEGYRLYLISDVLFKGQSPHLLVFDWQYPYKPSPDTNRH